MRQPTNSGWCVGITIITENLRRLYCPVLQKEWENGERTQMYFWNKLFHPRMVFKCRDPFFALFFQLQYCNSVWTMFVVLDACKIIFVKLNNEEMFLSFNDSHLLIWTNVLRDTVDSGLQVLDSSICHWNLDSGFQSLVRFRIPWAVFRIPKPRVPGSTSKICPDSYFNKGTILKPSQIPYYHNITL